MSRYLGVECLIKTNQWRLTNHDVCFRLHSDKSSFWFKHQDVSKSRTESLSTQAFDSITKSLSSDVNYKIYRDGLSRDRTSDSIT